MKLLQKFWRSEGGGVAISFALTLPVLITLIGGVIDHSRIVSAKQRLQFALDAGTLAASSLNQQDSAEDVVRRFIEQAVEVSEVPLENLSLEVVMEEDLYSRRVEVVARVTMDTFFLGMAGLDEIDIAAVSTAEEKVTNIEIALVLDISSSMSGNKISNLREASLSFVDTVLRANDEGATTISVIPYGGTVRLPDHFYPLVTTATEFSPDNLDYTVELPDDVSGWNGCLEFHGDEVTDIDLEDDSYGILPNFTKWNRNNMWCPPDDEAVAIFHSSDYDQISDVIGSFDNSSLSDGTGTDIGTSWGVRALDPIWQGRLNNANGEDRQPVAYGEERTKKIMIVMTDGGITAQFRPPTDITYEPDDDSIHYRNTATLYNGGTARNNFDDLCTYAKQNGVEVFTIAFQVNNARNRGDMEDCASGDGNYYDVRSLDIDAAFQGIANKVNPLRLTW
ncbi:MAG: hypothetical protein Alpg2KO_24790 [Alphaproteobacteria bacterium]